MTPLLKRFGLLAGATGARRPVGRSKSEKRPSVDAFDEQHQTGTRLDVLRFIMLGIILSLGVRLWWLQIMNHEVYAGQAEQNRIRILPIPARRGTIYDRHGKVLVDSRSSFNIVVSRKDVKSLTELSDLLVDSLQIDRAWLEKRFDDARFEPRYESVVVKELASARDVSWVRAHQYEHPELRAEEAPQRHYVFGTFAAHVLGYVGEVSPDELKKGTFSKENGYKLGDIIGKFGIERTYNEILTGKDGARRVIVDSRGRIQSEIERIEPVRGRDLYTTLDYDIQVVAEAQGDTMPQGRGALVVNDPKSGEILAMASRPSFDPNIFSQRAKTPGGKEEIRGLYEDPDKPLYNRVIQGRFPPGSTWKLMTAVAALNEGVITPTNSKIQDGGLQVGNYYMKSLSHEGFPDVHRAILRSCDGYFYRLGLKLGPDRFEKWVAEFHFGERTGIDLPGEQAGIAPTREMKAKYYPSAPKFTDYDMAASAFGQGTNALTPIQLLRYVSILAVGGQAHTPHLLLKGVPGIDRTGATHPETRYEDKNAFVVPMSDSTYAIVKSGMWAAVHEPGGTAGGARVDGFDICGKTGTAQVASTARVGSKTKDHAWFMSWAPRDKPELGIVVLTENVGFGGTHSAPRAKAIYEDYYKRTRHLEAEGEAAAKAN
jgi:penicillin-binding protein 2